ncbi:MAG: RIP metalloprotease RseP [Rhodobacteraceae bacterium]|uniref:RIP metalloprotease RseP n=1 Tax=Albidovulum sp. TaxID=1872424 RepID=UPI00265AFA92|nr:RIP metalloprotease RseP [uncultured Defluviimonas sp.]MCC0068668.1 RIP metalloprotease RseP [Paracoccaceae bacterium]
MDLPAFLTSLGDTLYTVGAFVLALSIIVAVHEYGHYIVGRWSGIHAEVFSIGFGPRLWSRVDRRGTRWQVAAVPFGGYVKFLGDANAASAGADDATMRRLSAEERRHTMHGAPLWARAATVFAGPAFNFLLSIAVFAVTVFATGVATDAPEIRALKPLPVAHDLQPGDRILAVNGIDTPDYKALGTAADALPDTETVDYRVLRGGREVTVTGPTLLPALVLSVLPRSAAMDAGLQEGDVILSMNGTPTPRFDDLQGIVKASGGKPLTLSVWRDGDTFETTLAPRERPVTTEDGGLETGYQIGISGSFMFEPATRRPGPLEALGMGVSQTWGVIETTFTGISAMIAGSISTCNVSGPVGMAQATGAAASAGLSSFIWLTAALSTAIGLLNLFPIPVLDGGHLVFHAYEWARGRPPSDRFMNAAMAVGLTVVLALMLFGLTNDLFCR